MDPEEQHELKQQDFIRHKLYSEKKSAVQQYKELVLGDVSLFALAKYEILTMMCGSWSGAFGLLLRQKVYPHLLGACGRGVVFGRNVILRHPSRIRLGSGVMIDDNSIIDARGTGDEGLQIGDNVIIGRGSTVQSKVGGIRIANEVNIGSGSVLVAQGGIEIEEGASLAGGCYVSGGVYHTGREDESDWEHGKFTRGPIRIGPRVRVGMRAIILDGVQIGEGAIVGTSSMVIADTPAWAITAGTPAKVLRMRAETDRD